MAAFDVAREIDPAYAQELDRAATAGVEVLPLAVSLGARKQKNGLYTLHWELTGLLPWTQR